MRFIPRHLAARIQVYDLSTVHHQTGFQKMARRYKTVRCLNFIWHRKTPIFLIPMTRTIFIMRSIHYVVTE